MFKTMFISGFIGVVISRLMKAIWGDTWTIYTCFVTCIVMLILLKEVLSDISITYIGHILFASITGFISSLLLIESSPQSIFNNVLLKITFSAITLLGIVTIGGFLKESYKLLKKFYPKKTIYVE